MSVLQEVESAQQDHKSGDCLQQLQTKLREELHVAEMEKSPWQKLIVHTTNVIIHGDPSSVMKDDGIEKPSLCPILVAELTVKKQTMKALIDTGSPVSIITIEFLLRVCE